MRSSDCQHTGASVRQSCTGTGASTAPDIGGGPSPFDSREIIIGFRATGSVKRSDFGLGKYVPIVSDETHIVISVAFKKTG